MTCASPLICGARTARWAVRVPLGLVVALLAACGTPPRQVAAPPAPPPAPAAPPAPAVAVPMPPPALPPLALPQPAPEPVQVQPRRSASAATARDYRRYGAGHIYAHHAHRIYKGQLPPMLYAVGVLNVDIDATGQVQRLDWMRAPRHAPEVMAEIERMVRAAAPFPAPARMGRVTWTDTWLWDRSGRFQLDTLTEGQLGRLAEPSRNRR